MRQGQQNRRGRGRGGNNSGGNRKGQSPLSRNYESSGPDVKIRGTASQIAEKYSALARDASSSGDTIMAENYLQHAEHYNRIIMAAQAQSSPDGAQAVNGVHRGGRDGGNASREQPQPQINAQPSEGDQPESAPATPNQGAEDQPAITPQPAAEDSAPSESKAGATSEANGEAETGRRRRRRYPGNGASRSSASSSEKGASKSEAAASEGQTSDEATA